MINDALTKTLPSVLQQYHANHDIRLVPLKVDLLRPMMQERGVVDRIIWEAADFGNKHVIAKVEFYRASMGPYAGKGDYARVQYDSALNFCWQRFVILKEMYHCILDDKPSRRITNVDDLKKLTEMLVSEQFASIESFEAHDTELLAEVMALETLFPMELRCRHKDDFAAGRISEHSLALRYRIPLMYAGMGMMESYYKSVYRTRVDSFIALT